MPTPTSDPRSAAPAAPANIYDLAADFARAFTISRNVAGGVIATIDRDHPRADAVHDLVFRVHYALHHGMPDRFVCTAVALVLENDLDLCLDLDDSSHDLHRHDLRLWFAIYGDDEVFFPGPMYVAMLEQWREWLEEIHAVTCACLAEMLKHAKDTSRPTL